MIEYIYIYVCLIQLIPDEIYKTNWLEKYIKKYM